MKKYILFILMFLFCSLGISEAQISTKILQAINTLVDAEGSLIIPNANYLTIGTTDTTLADLYLYQEASAAKDGILVFKGSDTNKTALKVTHNSTLSTRYIAEFLNSNGTVMKIGANSIVNLGADDLIAHLYINDAGTIVMYDDSNDTSVTIGPVADGTNTLGLTGSLSISGTISEHKLLATDADGKTLSSSEILGSIQMATGAGTWTIPDVDAASGTGHSFYVYSTTAAAIVVYPDNEDKIRLDGTLLAAGAAITSAGAAGDYIYLVLTDFDGDIAHWTVLGRSGTWTGP